MVKYKIEITPNEAKALKVLLYSEYKIYCDRVAHAASHGSVYVDEYGTKIKNVFEKIEFAILASDE